MALLNTYSKDLDQNEYYIKRDGKEVYALKKNVQFYAKKRNKKEFYAKDEHEQEYYAIKSDQSQYYAKNKSGKEIPITIGTKDIYAKDSKNADIYPTDNGRQYVLRDNGVAYYAKNENQEERYPVDSDNNDVVVENIFIRHKDGKIKLPVQKNGRPKYPKRGASEIYPVTDNNVPYYCKNREGVEVYAKNEKGDEYYLNFNSQVMFAKDRNGEYYYALDNNNVIIYPEDKNGEFYIKPENQSIYYLLTKSNFVTYAKRGKIEIYPTDIVEGGKTTEMLMDTYAELLTKGPFYPKDSNLNEYTQKDGLIIERLGYPITADGYIIVPNVENNPIFNKKDSQVTMEHIKKLLYRPDWKSYDFLTKLKSKRIGVNPLSTYKTLDMNIKNTSILYYIIAALTLIIITLIAFL